MAECKLWDGWFDSYGIPRDEDGNNVRREAYKLSGKHLPPNRKVLSTCGNRACYEVEHLKVRNDVEDGKLCIRGHKLLYRNKPTEHSRVGDDGTTYCFTCWTEKQEWKKQNRPESTQCANGHSDWRTSKTGKLYCLACYRERMIKEGKWNGK